jgi:hypothetical protein
MSNISFYLAYELPEEEPGASALRIELLTDTLSEAGIYLIGINTPIEIDSLLDQVIKSDLDSEMVPDSQMFARTLNMLLDGNRLLVPQNTAVFLGNDSCESLSCAALLMYKHGEVTGVGDEKFVYRLWFVHQHLSESNEYEYYKNQSFKELLQLVTNNITSENIKGKVHSFCHWLLTGSVIEM